MNFACAVRLFPTGEMAVVSYDVIEESGVADWISLRMVRLSKEAVDICLPAVVKALLPSKMVVDPSEMPLKKPFEKFVKFCGFSSGRKMDSSSKMVFIFGDEYGGLKFVPSVSERNAGFNHKDDEAIFGSFADGNFIKNLKEAFKRSEAGADWFEL